MDLNGRAARDDPGRATLLLFTEAAAFGGAEVHLADLARSIDPSRYRVAVVTYPGEAADALTARLQPHDIRVHLTPRPQGKGDLRGLASMAATFARIGPRAGSRTILHCHLATPYQAHLAMGIGRMMGMPVLATEHIHYPPSSPSLRRRRRLMQRLITHELAVSQAVGRALIEEFEQPRERVTVVSNGIDWRRHQVTSAQRGAARLGMRHALGIDPEALVVGSVGRLSPQKDYERLVRAAARLAPRVPIVVAVAGEGEKRRSLERLVETLGLGGRVLLPGFVEDIPGFLAGLDIFILTSRYEGLPLSLLEAMAAGLPAIATGVDGVLEALDHGRTGLMLPALPHEDQIAQAVEHLALDEELRRRMGQEAALVVARRFSLERQVARTELLYDHLLRRSTPRAKPSTRRPR